jgi:hypothetical protein
MQSAVSLRASQRPDPLSGSSQRPLKEVAQLSSRPRSQAAAAQSVVSLAAMQAPVPI